MEITITKEDLSNVDTGGGCRVVTAEIVIDTSQSKRQQRQAVLYETLAVMLDYVISHERLQEMTETLGEALDQIEGD